MSEREANLLRRVEAILFDSDDEDLKRFIQNYYKVIDKPVQPEGFMDILLYSDRFRSEFLAVSGITYLWSRKKIPDALKKMFDEKNVVEEKDLREEYVRWFLGQCSA